MEVWRAWYRGHVDSFHTYKTYSGRKTRSAERKTLNMAAAVWRRWADLLLNEKVDIRAGDETSGAVLEEALRRCNFYVRANNLIEAAFALGGGFFIEYWDGAHAAVKYVTQDQMLPLAFDSGVLSEAAFVSRKVIDGKIYVYLETHTRGADDCYVVDNALLARDEDGGLTPADASLYERLGLARHWQTGSREALFQSIRPNVANADDFNSPFGTSVFSGATDILKGIDLVYDSYCKEFLLGKKRIFVRDGVTNFNVDEQGNPIRVFDPNDEVFYSLPDANDESAPPLIESDLSLRTGEHDAALQTQLNLLSQAVGFGSNGFKWDAGNAATATQIISENSEMFRTLKKHEIILRQAICAMARGVLRLETAFGGAAVDAQTEISVNFDDSIIEDTAQIRAQAMLEYNAGLIDAVAYYQRVYRMTKAQAEDLAREIGGRKPAVEEEPDLE